MEIRSGHIIKGNAIGHHRIITNDDKPVLSQLYKLGGAKEEILSKIVKEYLKLGIIHPSESAWRSLIIVVPKKNGEHRLCIDYRRLNDATIKDAYPMPRVEKFINALEGATHFTKLGTESGYHLINMTPIDIEKTVFACRKRLFEFVKMLLDWLMGQLHFIGR